MLHENPNPSQKVNIFEDQALLTVQLEPFKSLKVKLSSKDFFENIFKAALEDEFALKFFLTTLGREKTQLVTLVEFDKLNSIKQCLDLNSEKTFLYDILIDFLITLMNSSDDHTLNIGYVFTAINKIE